jgi:hypothetical protein
MTQKLFQSGLISGGVGLFFIIISAVARASVDEDHSIRALGCVAFLGGCDDWENDYIPANVMLAIGIIAVVAGGVLVLVAKLSGRPAASMPNQTGTIGAPNAVATSFCTSCGTGITGTQFCGNCGAQVG